MDTEDIKIEGDLPQSKMKVIRKARRRSGRFMRYLIPVLYLLGDVAGIYGSFYLAYRARFFSGLVRFLPIEHGLPKLSIYLHAVIFVCAIWLFIFSLFGHYKRRSPSAFDRFYEVVRGVTAGTLLILATSFFYREESFSRIVLGLAWLAAILLNWIIRELIYEIEKHFLRKGVISKRAVIAGDCERGIELYNRLRAQPAWGIVPVGFVCDNKISQPCLGRMADLDEIVKTHALDMVIFNLPQESQNFIVDFVMKSENLRLEYMISPDILGLMTFNSESSQIEGIPVLRWGSTPIEGYSRLVKRIFDITLSSLGIIGLSPVFLVISLAVKLDSPGPVLFKQRRVGRNGREFTVYKFRSMFTNGQKENGAGWTVKDDPRRTKVGKVIRKFNLDELPQLFNVLFGQMSLVGPRPEQPDYVVKFKDDIPRYFQRHRVKSGLTGWAQVNGFRGDTSITERTKYDLYYVENWSLIFDIRIILLTIKNIFKSQNAY
jgi:exopolysaccharide biosynthesis polyprenyl glycosylphosphotransferase